MKTSLLLLSFFCTLNGIAELEHDSSNISIKGKVLDYHSNKPVPNLEMHIEGINVIKATDASGKFKFIIPDTLLGKNIVLNVTAKGQQFLDSTGSVIGETKLQIDTIPLKSEVIIYRYPIDTLPMLIIKTGRILLQNKF